MEITLEEIQNKFESLPENLKWAIMDANIDENITSIGQRHGLNIEQLGQLSLETHMVVLGYTHPDKFEESLKESFKFPDEKNREIIQDINEKILKNIREKLISLDNKNDEYLEPIEEEQEKIEANVPETSKSNYIRNMTGGEIEENKNEKEIENKKIMESVTFKKLSGSFSAPIKKTEYSLPNISKEEEKNGTSVNQNVKIPNTVEIKHISTETTSISPSYSIKEDPYRMKPE